MSERHKVKMSLTELGEPEVSHISLVKRGAMRTPFKIIKSETEEAMKHGIDLRGLFFGVKKAESLAPEVVALVVKTEEAEGITASLLERGHTVLKTEEDSEGLTTLALKEEFDMEEAVVFKANEHVGVAVANVKKAFYSWPDSGEFAENIQKAGFFPGLYLANEVLTETVYSIMNSVEQPAEATAKLETALKQHQEYVMALSQNLPVKAFKFEDLAPKAPEAPAEPAEPVVKAEGEEEGGESTPVVQEEGTEEPPAEGAEPVVKAEGEEEAPAVAPIDPDKFMGTLQEMITKAVSGVETSLAKKFDTGMSEVTGKVEALKKDVDSVKEQARKAEEAVHGTLTPGAETDESGKTGIQKTEKKESVFNNVLKFDGLE